MFFRNIESKSSLTKQSQLPFLTIVQPFSRITEVFLEMLGSTCAGVWQTSLRVCTTREYKYYFDNICFGKKVSICFPVSKSDFRSLTEKRGSWRTVSVTPGTVFRIVLYPFPHPFKVQIYKYVFFVFVTIILSSRFLPQPSSNFAANHFYWLKGIKNTVAKNSILKSQNHI